MAGAGFAPRVAVVGPGVVGQTIGRLLREAGFNVISIAGRTVARARAAAGFIGGGVRVVRMPCEAVRGADIVFLTTPDRALKAVCDVIAESNAWSEGTTVFHCSGALGPEVLASARRAGAQVGALHPIQTFPSPAEAVRRMKGTWFTFDGDAGARRVAARVVKALGGRLTGSRPRNRVMYHAALCVLSNYGVALADMADAMLRGSGLSATDAALAIHPLMIGTVENIAALGPARALTGPIARGDAETVAAHLRSLGRLPAEVRRLYAYLGLYTVRLARKKGTLAASHARRLNLLLRSAARA